MFSASKYCVSASRPCPGSVRSSMSRLLIYLTRLGNCGIGVYGKIQRRVVQLYERVAGWWLKLCNMHFVELLSKLHVLFFHIYFACPVCIFHWSLFFLPNAFSLCKMHMHVILHLPLGLATSKQRKEQRAALSLT
jgi:hypothetical protein